MNLQANAFLFSLKKVKWLFLMYFIIICIYIFNLYENNLTIPIQYDDMLYVMGILTKKEMYLSLSLLFSISQVLLILLLLIYFNNYEKQNSPEFVYLRTSFNRTLLIKFTISFLMIFIIRCTYVYFLYLFFKDYFQIHFFDIFLSIIVYLVIVIILYIYEYICSNLFKKSID